MCCMGHSSCTKSCITDMTGLLGVFGTGKSGFKGRGGGSIEPPKTERG